MKIIKITSLMIALSLIVSPNITLASEIDDYVKQLNIRTQQLVAREQAVVEREKTVLLKERYISQKQQILSQKEKVLVRKEQELAHQYTEFSSLKSMYGSHGNLTEATRNNQFLDPYLWNDPMSHAVLNLSVSTCADVLSSDKGSEFVTNQMNKTLGMISRFDSLLGVGSSIDKESIIKKSQEVVNFCKENPNVLFFNAMQSVLGSNIMQGFSKTFFPNGK